MEKASTAVCTGRTGSSQKVQIFRNHRAQRLYEKKLKNTNCTYMFLLGALMSDPIHPHGERGNIRYRLISVVSIVLFCKQLSRKLHFLVRPK